jgi:hypothetical protein
MFVLFGVNKFSIFEVKKLKKKKNINISKITIRKEKKANIIMTDDIVYQS